MSSTLMLIKQDLEHKMMNMVVLLAVFVIDLFTFSPFFPPLPARCACQGWEGDKSLSHGNPGIRALLIFQGKLVDNLGST